MQHQGYRVEAISRGRATIVDALAVGARRHMVHGFVEVDVTRARRIIRQHELETGEVLSFTAFIVAAAARAIAAHKHLNAYRDWRNRLVVFDDIDVATLIESDADAVAVAHVDPGGEPEERIRNPPGNPGRSGAASEQPPAIGSPHEAVGAHSRLPPAALSARRAPVPVVAQTDCRHDDRDRRRDVRGQGRRLGGGDRPLAHAWPHAGRDLRGPSWRAAGW